MKWTKEKYKQLIEDYAKHLLKNKYKIANDMINKNNRYARIVVESIDEKIRIKTEIYKTTKFYKKGDK